MGNGHFGQADAARLPLADGSVDLVFGSPPYVDARLYLENGQDLGIARKCVAWVEWMLTVTTEALRVSRGPVLWVAAGKTEGRDYQPACEGLMWEWFKRGGEVITLGRKKGQRRAGSMYRPAYWHRVGVCGSGGDQWLRADVEYVMCFKRPGKLPYADNTAMGHTPKWGPGGEMSNRLGSGARVNQWGKCGSGRGMGARKADGSYRGYHRPSHEVRTKEEWVRLHTKREPDGTMRSQSYSVPKLANPGNLVKTLTGGGHMGHPLAHDNEAPFPEALAEFFIRSFCPEGGIVLDTFSGSGTTVATALKWGRKGIGFDLRLSQCELGRRRILNPWQRRTKKKPAGKKDLVLFAEVA